MTESEFVAGVVLVLQEGGGVGGRKSELDARVNPISRCFFLDFCFL